MIIGGAILLVYRGLRRRRRSANEFRDVKEAARSDLMALADDVQVLEHKVEGNPAAQQDYLAALDKYGAASAAFDSAMSTRQLTPVAESLEEGRYLMASAEARLEGREPPERRPACFFDPRHGPSVRDVEWTPPGGRPREVPACAACATRIEDGEEPDSREVLVGGRTMPYWAAGPAYGGYFGGFFPGLLLGEVIGGGLGWVVATPATAAPPPRRRRGRRLRRQRRRRFRRRRLRRWRRRRRWRLLMAEESQEERLNRELIELLNELRVALPGVQVLFAFLLTLPFTNAFSQLSDFDRAIYFLALMLSAIASGFLIAPSAHHRLRFRNRDKEQLILWGNRMAICGLVTLSLGIAASIAVVADYLYGEWMRLPVTIAVLVFFGVLWFGAPRLYAGRRDG